MTPYVPDANSKSDPDDTVSPRNLNADIRAIKVKGPSPVSVVQVGDLLTFQLEAGYSATSFDVHRVTAAGVDTTIVSAGPATYTLVAADKLGGTRIYPVPNGLALIPVGITAPLHRPGPPVMGSATAGNNSVSVTFSAPTLDGGSPILGYQVRTPNGVRTTFDGAVTSAAVNAAAGVPITVAVRARNVVGYGPWSDASNVVTPTVAPASDTRVPMGGRGGWPGTTALSTNNVRTVDSFHVVPPGNVVDYIGTIGNYYLNNGGQSVSGLQAFNVSGSVRFGNAAAIPMLWGVTPEAARAGVANLAVAPGVDVYCYYPAPAAGTFVHERVTTEGGAGNITRLLNQGVRSSRYEGLAQSTTTALTAGQQAFTDGVDCVLQPPNRDPATGFIALPGNGTTGSVVSPGVGWTGASSILLVDPVDGTVATFGFTNGAHTIGTMNAGAGSTRFWNVGSYFVVVNTVSGDTAGHGLHARFATVVSGQAPGRLLVTNSIGRGINAGDANGDFKANYGLLERLINSLSGFTAIGVGGNTATAFRDYFPTSGLKAVLDATKVVYDEVWIELGDNDVAQPYSFAIIQSALTTIAAYWQAKGSKVLLCTIPPRSSTSDGQTPLTPGFVDGGVRDQCNVAIRANTMIPGQRGFIEIATPCEQPGDHTRWVVGYCDSLGVHPNDTCIRYALTTAMYQPRP